MPDPAPRPCLVEGCDQPAADSPVALCHAHAVLVAEWDARHRGVPDALPSPCPACGSRLGIRMPSAWICAVCEWRQGDMPDHDLPPPRVDVVYYLRFADRVKIGTTANPRQRFSALRHDELLAFERGDRSLERRRHEQFAAERWPGTEWFATSDRLREHIAAVAAGIDDPWLVHARWVSEAWAARG